MKRVKFDGRDWILITGDGGFFNPNSEVYFYSYAETQAKIRDIVSKVVSTPQVGVIYEIPDSGIYTAVCGPQCGPFWPNQNCRHCGGKGVGATFSDGPFNMGSTDEGNQEVENIMNGQSNIHPELS